MIAKELIVSPDGEITSINRAIDIANDNDKVKVLGGEYREKLFINKKLEIIGIDRPKILGDGKGSVVSISTSGCIIKGFHISGSGTSLTLEDAGIVTDSASYTVIEDNILEDVLFGIYLKNSPKSIVSNNIVYGKELPLPERGDGIRLWYSSETKVLNNTIQNSRDLVMWWSGNTIIKGNEVRDGRYGLHYMYSNNNVFEDNKFIGNSVGGFLMYSSDISFYHNVFAKNKGIVSGYGVGFKDLDNVVAKENLFIDNRVGMYLDNSPHLINSYNEIMENVIAFNDIGISLMPSIERNYFVKNSFIENYEQVEIRGGGILKGNFWYKQGSGNFWSDYFGYDQNNDGIGDTPYVSESLFESVIDTYENLRLFIYSPVSQAMELAASAFPVVKPVPKFVDKFPLSDPLLPSNFYGKKKALSPSFLMLSLILILLPVAVYLLLIRSFRVGK